MTDGCWVRRIGWWTVYAAAFGVVEATVVVYIRRIVGIPQGAGYTAFLAGAWAGYGSGTFSEVMRSHELLQVETIREAATMLLLAGAACGACGRWRERLSLFLFTFAVWDITYYIYLALAAGFPRSLLSTDVYFLIPAAWVGPVWFPVLVVMPGLIVLSLYLARPFTQRGTSARERVGSLPRPRHEG